MKIVEHLEERGLEVRSPQEVLQWLRKNATPALKALRRSCTGPISLQADARLARDGWAMKGLPPIGEEETEEEDSEGESDDDEFPPVAEQPASLRAHLASQLSLLYLSERDKQLVSLHRRPKMIEKSGGHRPSVEVSAGKA